VAVAQLLVVRHPMRYVPFFILLFVASCMSRPATTAMLHTSGFPDVHIVAPDDAGPGPWSGTARCFQSDSGELFYFTILFDDAYDRYCTAQLAVSGITNLTVKLGRMSYEPPKMQPGFQSHPDRVDLSFIVYDKPQAEPKPIHLVYLLPASSKALGQTAGFSKLGRKEQVTLCVKSVTSDMEGIAQELVQRLKMPNTALEPTPTAP
jgi:hypothetical protein